MARRIAVAVLLCAVMVAVASAPSVVGDSHEIVKYEGGPNASAVSWEYVPLDYGVWYGHIVNNGLRWLTIDVYDNTTGALVEIMHEKIRFAQYGAYPTGVVDTKRAVMSPTHRYLITATPSGPKGSSCTIEGPFVAPLPPVAIFSAEVDHMTVAVSSSGSNDPDGVIVSYAWSFGDGAVATGSTATHTYAKTGTYVITLELTDNDGLTSSTQQTIQIGVPPVASFLVDVQDYTVYVDATGSSDSDGWIVGTLFEWGDGSMSSPAVTQHTYVVPGDYTIILTVWDNDGLTNQTSATVHIKDLPPTAIFSCERNGLSVSVTGYGHDDWGIVAYAWNWGDGADGTGQSATHEYASAGTYTITLTVTDTVGQTGGESRTFSIAHLPVASFTYTLVGSTVYVDASESSAEAGIASYTWNWGDGTVPEVLAIPTAEHTYGGTTSAVSASTESSGLDIIIEPDTIYGYTYAGDGTLLADCEVTVTNVRSGEVVTTFSDSVYAFYMVSFYYDYPGDVIEVTAVKGSLSGTNSGIIEYGGGLGLLQLDVYLLEGPSHVLTLTVTDTLGQTSSMTQLVLI